MHCIADLLVNFANSRVCDTFLVHAIVHGTSRLPGLPNPSEDLFPKPAPPATAGSELVCGDILSDILSCWLRMVDWTKVRKYDFGLWWNKISV
jgi:hypothetical protein